MVAVNQSEESIVLKPSFESVLEKASKDYAREKDNLRCWQSTKEFFESYFQVESAHKKRKNRSRFDFFYEVFLGKCGSFRPSIYCGENPVGEPQRNNVGINFYLPRPIGVKGESELYSRKKENPRIPWVQSEKGSIIFSATPQGIDSFFIQNPLETHIKAKYMPLIMSEDSFAFVSGVKVNVLSEGQINQKNGVVLGDNTLSAFFEYLGIKEEMQRVVK